MCIPIIDVFVILQRYRQRFVRLRDAERALLHTDRVVRVAFSCRRHRDRILAYFLSSSPAQAVDRLRSIRRLARYRRRQLRIRGRIVIIDLRLVVGLDRDFSRLDRQLRTRRRGVLVVRIRALYVDCVLARIDLRQARQIRDILPVLLEAVAVRRRSARCCARRGVVIVVLSRVVSVLVIIQADRELLAALLDRQRTIHYRDVIVRSDVRAVTV